MSRSLLATNPSTLKHPRIHRLRSGAALYGWVLSYLRPYGWLLTGLIAAGIFISAGEMFIPLLIQQLIDQILPARQMDLFWQMLAAAVGITVMILAANACQNSFQRIIQERASRDLQLNAFKHLRKLGFSYFERTPVGEMLSLINQDVGAVQQIYRSHFPSLVKDLLMGIVAASFLFAIDWRLTFAILPCYFFYYILGPYFEKKAALYGKQQGIDRGLLGKKLYESVSSLLVLRSYRAFDWDMSQYVSRQHAFNESRIRNYLFAIMRGSNRRFSIDLGFVVIFVFGAYLIGEETITVGQLVAFSFYYVMLMSNLTMVVTNLTEQKVILYQAERLYEFMNRKPEVDEPADPVKLPPIRGHIEFENVHFSYPSRPAVLQGVSFRIAPGQKIGVVGTSGGGKSTVLKLVARFYDPNDGDIRLDGVSIRALSLAQLRESIGFVFQETYLFGGTVRDNIRFSLPSADDDQIEAAARAAYAHEFITALPNGYDTIVGERGIKLSGGQKQRIAIARMFVKNPAIIVLDEATSALDNISEYEVQKALDALLVGRTTITVAHRLTTVRHADHIMVLDQGRIVEQGTYAELVKHGGVFARLAAGEEEAQHA